MPASKKGPEGWPVVAAHAAAGSTAGEPGLPEHGVAAGPKSGDLPSRVISVAVVTGVSTATEIHRP